jgi:hypothetical protein
LSRAARYGVALAGAVGFTVAVAVGFGFAVAFVLAVAVEPAPYLSRSSSIFRTTAASAAPFASRITAPRRTPKSFFSPAR